MILSRKHYHAIAEIIKEVGSADWVRENAQSSTGVDTCNAIANLFADSFACSNPRFSREQFLTACGFGSPEN